jgi:hypothetical protein
MEFAPFGQYIKNACGGRLKSPPEAVKQLSVGHSFRFSFFVFNF